MTQLLGTIQAVVMFAGMLLLGQLAVRIISFGRHEQNAVYRFFRFLTSPVVRLTRAITPRQVDDRHVPVVAFFLLFWIFFALAIVIPMFSDASRG